MNDDRVRYEDLELTPMTDDEWRPFYSAISRVDRADRLRPVVNGLFWFLVVSAVVAIIALLISAPQRASESSPRTPALPEASISAEGVSQQPSPVPLVAAARVPRSDERESVLPPTSISERVMPLPVTDAAVTGRASWYCGAGSRCTRGVPAGAMAAAAGPALRVGNWRGRIVRVESGGRAVLVRLVDWCACPSRVIDLYRSAFSRLASPSRGVILVSITWSSSGSSRRATATLPPTDTR